VKEMLSSATEAFLVISWITLRDLLKQAEAILPDCRHADIVSPEGTEPLDSDDFALVERHQIYIYRNLTRVVIVVRRG